MTYSILSYMHKLVIFALCLFISNQVFSTTDLKNLSQNERFELALKDYRAKFYVSALKKLYSGAKGIQYHRKSLELLALIHEKQMNFSKAIRVYKTIIKYEYTLRVFDRLDLTHPRDIKHFNKLPIPDTHVQNYLLAIFTIKLKYFDANSSALKDTKKEKLLASCLDLLYKLKHFDYEPVLIEYYYGQIDLRKNKVNQVAERYYKLLKYIESKPNNTNVYPQVHEYILSYLALYDLRLDRREESKIQINKLLSITEDKKLSKGIKKYLKDNEPNHLHLNLDLGAGIDTNPLLLDQSTSSDKDSSSENAGSFYDFLFSFSYISPHKNKKYYVLNSAVHRRNFFNEDLDIARQRYFHVNFDHFNHYAATKTFVQHISYKNYRIPNPLNSSSLSAFRSTYTYAPGFNWHNLTSDWEIDYPLFISQYSNIYELPATTMGGGIDIKWKKIEKTQTWNPYARSLLTFASGSGEVSNISHFEFELANTLYLVESLDLKLSYLLELENSMASVLVDSYSLNRVSFDILLHGDEYHDGLRLRNYYHFDSLSYYYNTSESASRAVIGVNLELHY